MKIKLKEAAQPINKLDYNIENIVLPTFKQFGYEFNSNPVKYTPYKNMYSGVYKDYKTTVRLYLYTTAPEIDLWNEENADEFTADLFAEIHIGLNKVPLGPISSKDPGSIGMQLDSAGLEDLTFGTHRKEEQAKQEVKKEKSDLIPPKSGREYKAMTEEQWNAEKKRLAEEIDKARAAVDDALPPGDDTETYEVTAGQNNYAKEAWKNYWKKKQEDPSYEEPSIIAMRNALAKYNYFMRNVYPLDGGY